MIILSILAAIAIPLASKTREDAIDKEAVANLYLLQSAEKIKKDVDDEYASGSDADALNSALRLMLPTPASGAHWNYKVVAAGTEFTAKAQRTSDTSRVKCIDQNDKEPFTDGCAW